MTGLNSQKLESAPNTVNAIVKKEAEETELLKCELKKLVIENNKYKDVIREQKEEIYDLENKVKVKNAVANKLNQQLREVKTKNDRNGGIWQSRISKSLFKKSSSIECCLQLKVLFT